MSNAATADPSADPSAVLPFHDPSRRRRLIKVAGWLIGIALLILVLDLLGVDVRGWLSDLWQQIKDVPARYIVAGLTFQTGADAARRALLLRHPARGLPRSRRVLADRHRLCRGRGHEQLPAGEHRHLRDAADVRRDHPGVHVRRCGRRLPRAEDLLHGRRNVRLPLPLPLRAGLVRPQPRQPLEASRRVDRRSPPEP